MIAIIPARGGSKGLPGKNIKNFHGHPLISYAIREAQKSKYIDRVIVSTDDNSIAEVAKEYNAEIPFLRPTNLAQDTSPVIETYFYTIEKLKETENYEVDDFIVLQPTSPLRNVNHIDESIQLYYNKKADSVISVSEMNHPIEWTKTIDKHGKLISLFEDNSLNRQEYKKNYLPNGMIYIFKYSSLKRNKDYYMKDTYPYIVDNTYSVDIDDILDFDFAQFLYKKLYL